MSMGRSDCSPKIVKFCGNRSIICPYDNQKYYLPWAASSYSYFLACMNWQSNFLFCTFGN